VAVFSVPPNRSESVSYRLTFSLLAFFSFTLRMEETRSSETSVYNKLTRCHVPEDGILHIPNVSIKHLMYPALHT
jgi:hypothetical protein